MRYGPGLRPVTVFVETTDDPHGPRAHVRHATDSTMSALIDPLTQSAL